MSDKNFKIWGVSYGLVGDLIMGLPVLRYFEKKYPGSYKIWAIEKKVGFMAPFFLNHPLIDRIKITDEWNGFGRNDYHIAAIECDYACTMNGWEHSRPDWYNYTDCIEETAHVAGVTDLLSVLSGEDLYPKLEQWFDAGEDSNLSTYSKSNTAKIANDDIISIFPFATATSNITRSPSPIWWGDLVGEVNRMGYRVIQFGMPSDSIIKNIHWRYNNLTFFDQVKIALSTKMSIGTDSGNMWVMGAYNHPAIHLMTNWLPNHTKNHLALAPVNKSAVNIFESGGVNNISIGDVLYNVERMMGRTK